MPATTDTTPPRPLRRAPWLGLGVAVAVLVLASAVPWAFDIDTVTRNDDKPQIPPLHGFWDPGLGQGTLPAILLAVLGSLYAVTWAQRAPWRLLLAGSFALGLAWMVALAYVDGPSGIDRVLGNPYEYLETAREVDDVGAMLRGFTDRIPYAHPDNWVVHVAGHPPGALLLFVGLVRVGLGGDYAAGMTVTVLAATIAPTMLVLLRRLGAEGWARRAAPFLVLSPAAVFLAVSADAAFAAFAVWGLAALAHGAAARRRPAMVAWSVLAGLLLGWCVLLSYGLPLLGVAALAVLAAARSWWPLPVAAVAALALVLGFAVAGWAWWEAYPVLVERYHDGVASERPTAYWWFGNLGALLYSTGPLLGAGLAAWAVSLRGVAWRRPGPVATSATSGDDDSAASGEEGAALRTVALLVGAGVAMVALADASGMSKSEVERIWLPFVPFLLLATALLPTRWRRWGLVLQVTFALVVQHLLYTSW